MSRPADSQFSVGSYVKNELLDELIRRYLERLRQLVQRYRESGGREPSIAELERQLVELAKLVEERLQQYVRTCRRSPLYGALVTKHSMFSYAGYLLAVSDFLEALEEVRHGERAENE